jgi:hypothetical protein
MLVLVLILALSAPDSPPNAYESANVMYGKKDVDGLQRLCATPDTREVELFCAYRLYPLTQNEKLLSDLPTSLKNGSAREYALLSGLWGYRTASASIPNVIRFGRAAESAMREARQLDPNDPFVLLIDGQSLLFKPRIAGGDRRLALETFEALAEQLTRSSDPDIELIEARVWIWYARMRLNDRRAPEVRAALLASAPPQLYREFLLSPP